MNTGARSFPSYRIQPVVQYPIVQGILRGKPRSWKKDANRLAQSISSIQINGSVPPLPEHHRGWLVLINHYARPGFGIWWAVAALSAWFPHEIHWVMSARWTYHDLFRSKILTPITRWIFHRISTTYSFTPMPAMPPIQGDQLLRVTAVRNLTQYVRGTGLPVVGLAPEGMDHPSGHLSMPPHGSGKLIWYLSKQGLAILPVGIFEQDRALRFQIGPVTQIESMAVTDHEILDQKVALKAMEAISACLPTSFPSAISLHLDRE